VTPSPSLNNSTPVFPRAPISTSLLGQHKIGSNKSLVSLSTEKTEDETEKVQQHQKLQLNRRSNFTSSSKTLCNYPYLDDSLSLKFNQTDDMDDYDVDECDDGDDLIEMKNKKMSSSFNTDEEMITKSPMLKHQHFNNPISYPSLSRRNFDRISKSKMIQCRLTKKLGFPNLFYFPRSRWSCYRR
jgi:hypothetical protein